MGYYVYELVLMPDAVVCYVGKGSGNRVNEHFKVLRNPRHSEYNRARYKALRSLVLPGKSLEARIVYETENEVDAFLHEKALIERYGFAQLANVASHAFLGRTLKPVVRAIISERIRALWHCGRYGHRKRRRRDLPRKWPSFPVFYRRHKAGYKGVTVWKSKGKRSSWMARIWLAGRSKTIGYRASAQEAAQLYDDVFESYHGSRPNGTSSTLCGETTQATQTRRRRAAG